MIAHDQTSERLVRLRRMMTEWTRTASTLAHDNQEVAVHWAEAVADLEQLIRQVERTESRELAVLR